MIDIHCHIIFGVDDGPSTVKDSIRMILEAEKLGVNKIIVTPHYNKNIYKPDKILENFYNVKSRIRDFGIELFLGYEVFLVSSINDVFLQKYKYTLNKSKYLLFELPFDIMPVNINETLLKLHAEGIVPIIAHPERNIYFARNTQKFIDLIETGCLVQLDAASIVGIHGSNVKKFAKKLIDLNLVQFVASDAHKPEDYEVYKKSYDIVKNWAGKEYSDKIFAHNQEVIINPPVTQPDTKE
ncbi:tyrosine-protein phosphatase [Acetivibrio clariflavus]|uniref:protein-tyrosine-phosphatase n=1 Tax=Acetivibrio clariflavus (strain DSM 19732 / NBRC 101661 / EBR45) TaxID=720554 RepID=G8LX29_ACECE|nr:CpsB/CapC family capsule biosynthesis tyrosine phosphatase [Acetivibrio clariflavus]AEV67681.1 capsular polysaccharide biosynthesis protein [Acetivibrio clariflavus DSM 19732]HPU40920.1 phosphoesterase [Acetivibrio clariflavus]